MTNKFLFRKKLRNRFAEIDRQGEEKLKQRFKEIGKKYQDLTELRLKIIENEYGPMMNKLKSMQRKIEAVPTKNYEILGKILVNKQKLRSDKDDRKFTN